MISSNKFNEPSNEFCKYDAKCEKAATKHCQGCGQMYCMDHYLEHRRNLQEHFQYVIYTLDLLNQKLESLLSQLSTNAISNLIKPICEFKAKSDEMVNTADIIQQQLSDLISQDQQDLEKPLITTTNALKFDQNGYLEDDIERLGKDVGESESKLEGINHDSQTKISQEQLQINDTKVLSNNPSETMKSLPLNPVSPRTKYSSRTIVGNLNDSMTRKADDTSTLSYLFPRQMNSLLLDLNENELVPTEVENKTNPEEEEIIVVLDSNTTPKIQKKIHLANNIVLWLRGPLKLMVNGIMHTADLCAQGTHIRDGVLQAVHRRIEERKQFTMKQQTTNNAFKPAFTEITSDWTPEGENSDKGFSSSTNWIRDPQDRRLLVKTQELPLGAANEWLAYVLGSALGLPVNEVQISIYENNLVTLHTDITQEDEKTITLLEAPMEQRNKLMTHPIMESMDLFDHILQNVDRNLRNILVTIPNTSNITDENVKLKIRLIDHSSCFGMGKLNFISIVAQKFHSSHLSVVKFDPIHKAREFEQYLNEVPISDRILIRETLKRFATITDDQFDIWITGMQDLLSSSQYNRIHSVLRRQRDTARRYAIQWDICPESLDVKPN